MINTIDAPDNAMAIIVDISAPGGKFVIGRHAPTPWGNDVVAERATEGKTHLVIWPWQPEWQFYAIGSTKIRYLVKPSNAT
ncbi:unnamed protein product [Penicillium roqueforti FM164]|uniref:Genomic scaffold, ProqFM164S01 n=1 Tax=Penicillium roqueforti (strain FM164) TaxID=1365484 RepID=W6PWE9_PENRF|nr:unnamed protein product [Penicillium roqueforti FM164]